MLLHPLVFIIILIRKKADFHRAKREASSHKSVLVRPTSVKSVLVRKGLVELIPPDQEKEKKKGGDDSGRPLMLEPVPAFIDHRVKIL